MQHLNPLNYIEKMWPRSRAGEGKPLGLLHKTAIAVMAIDMIALAERVPDDRMTERPAAAIALDFIRIHRDSDEFGDLSVRVRWVGHGFNVLLSNMRVNWHKPRLSARGKESMTADTITFTDNPAIESRMERYVTLKLSTAHVLAGWRSSLMAHEWLDQNGHVRKPDTLNMLDRDKVLKAERILDGGGSLPRPVLGIGIFDNIEIGAGRDIFCLLVLKGARTIEAHVPRSNEKEFKAFSV